MNNPAFYRPAPDQFTKDMNMHSYTQPHWSVGIKWRDGRWDPLTNAPTRGNIIMSVRGRDREGRIYEPVHYAHGDGDGLMPPFIGWFRPATESRGFIEVSICEWQPLWAKPTE